MSKFNIGNCTILANEAYKKFTEKYYKQLNKEL